MQVVWSSGFTRSFKKITKRNSQLKEQITEVLILLAEDPFTHADPDGGYVAEIKDLPGCLTQGESIEETMKNINEARELWIETVFELGKSIPLPSD
jgi:antitoxin HicB